MTALRITAALVWWTPSIVLALVGLTLFSVGYAYRSARARRLMEAGDLDEAERVVARLRRDVEAMRERGIYPSRWVEPR